jgi:hypothetical protein
VLPGWRWRADGWRSARLALPTLPTSDAADGWRCLPGWP